MGIISQTAKLIVSNRSKCYEKLGYNIPKRYSESRKEMVYDIGSTFEVNVNDLQKGTKAYLDYECDICGDTFSSNSIDLRKCRYCFCDKCLTIDGKKIQPKTIYFVQPLCETDSWLEKYIKNKSFMKLYGKNSHTKTEFICEMCGNEFKDEIRNITESHSCTCVYCKDGVSYPNKYLRCFLAELNIDSDYEYSPEWLKPYRFDSYFEYKNKKYVIEMDGGIGHGNKKFNSNEKDINGKKIDDLKDSLADNHNIIVIRIDATKSESDYISNNIKNSCLSDIFDLSLVNWDNCAIFAEKNLLKDVCNYYSTCSEEEKSTQNLINKFHISRDTIRKYLIRGTELGICKYDRDLSEKFRKQNAYIGSQNRMKKIYVYDLNENFLFDFINVHECERYMSEKYNKIFKEESIRQVCRGQRKHLYGFFFSYERSDNLWA